MVWYVQIDMANNKNTTKILLRTREERRYSTLYTGKNNIEILYFIDGYLSVAKTEIPVEHQQERSISGIEKCGRELNYYYMITARPL